MEETLYEQAIESKPLWVEGYTLTKKDEERLNRLFGAFRYRESRAYRTATQAVMHLFFALRSKNSSPTLRHLVKLARRIKYSDPHMQEAIVKIP